MPLPGEANLFVQIITEILSLGPMGVILIMFYFNIVQNREDRKESKSNLDKLMQQYQKDMAEVREFYENNVELVKDYQKLSSELANIIHLNTQVQTRLVDRVETNAFCPAVREAGPKGQ